MVVMVTGMMFMVVMVTKNDIDRSNGEQSDKSDGDTDYNNDGEKADGDTSVNVMVNMLQIVLRIMTIVIIY